MFIFCALDCSVFINLYSNNTKACPWIRLVFLLNLCLAAALELWCTLEYQSIGAEELYIVACQSTLSDFLYTDSYSISLLCKMYNSIQ